jgi:hypothetical protein
MDAPYAGPQAGAVLDIGGTVGALLVYADAELSGREIELFGEDGRAVMHTEVHDRAVGGRTVHAGLFPAVNEGTYVLVSASEGGGCAVTVRGGEVSVVSLVRDEKAAAAAGAAGGR